MREIQRVNKHLGKCLALLVIRAIKIKAVLRCCLILIKVPRNIAPKCTLITSSHNEVGVKV